MASQDQAIPLRPIRPGPLLAAAAWAAICLAAAAFVYLYVLHYYLHFGPKGLGVYWPRRWGLVTHISAGAVALGIGPLQFWTGLRARRPRVHRWLGRTYLAAVSLGTAAALYLAWTTTFGWPFGFALAMLALAWSSTTAMAYVAIRSGAVPLHRRWMVRSYVVTFAFVVFRALEDWLPTSHVGPPQDLAVAAAWASWVLPLLATVVIQDLGDLRRHGRRRTG